MTETKGEGPGQANGGHRLNYMLLRYQGNLPLPYNLLHQLHVYFVHFDPWTGWSGRGFLGPYIHTTGLTDFHTNGLTD